MFTVKQETYNCEGVWTDISHVTACYAPGEFGPKVLTCVYGLFKDGGEVRFDAGPNPQTIYVMNANGSTVSRYNLHDTNAVSPIGLQAGPDPMSQKAA